MATRRNTALLLGIVVVIGLASWALTGRTPHLPGEPLAAVPRGATAVLHVDLPAVLSSQIWDRLVVARGGDQNMRRIETLCGGDPLSSLSKLTAFASGDAPGDLERVGLIVRGSFDPASLGDCVRRVVEADGGELHETEVDGLPAVRGRGGSRAVFIGRDGIAGGDEETVKGIVATLRGNQASALRDPVLSSLYAEVSPGRDAVMVAHVPQGWRRALRERLRAAEDADLGAVAGVRALGIGAALSDGLSLDLHMRMRDEGEAHRAAGALARVIEDALDAGGFAAAVTRPILSQLRVRAEGTSVHASVELTPARLDTAVTILIGLLDRPANADRAEPRDEPEPDEIIRRP